MGRTYFCPACEKEYNSNDSAGFISCDVCKEDLFKEEIHRNIGRKRTNGTIIYVCLNCANEQQEYHYTELHNSIEVV